jgi:hypothetical protein
MNSDFVCGAQQPMNSFNDDNVLLITNVIVCVTDNYVLDPNVQFCFSVSQLEQKTNDS